MPLFSAGMRARSTAPPPIRPRLGSFPTMANWHAEMPGLRATWPGLRGRLRRPEGARLHFTGTDHGRARCPCTNPAAPCPPIPLALSPPLRRHLPPPRFAHARRTLPAPSQHRSPVATSPPARTAQLLGRLPAQADAKTRPLGGFLPSGKVAPHGSGRLGAARGGAGASRADAEPA